ncbi:MAG: DUF885 domain-containing protein [Micromonosporaceae bacterium]
MADVAETRCQNSHLASLAHDYFQFFLATRPLFAASMGLPSQDELVGDPSREAERVEAAALQRFEDQLCRIEPSGLDSRDRITRSILALRLRHERDALLAGLDEVSISASAEGDLSMILMTMPQAPLTDAADAVRYLDRLAALGGYFDALRRRYLQAKADGRYPTASGIGQAVEQLDGYLAGDLRSDPLLRPRLPHGIAKDQWRAQAEQIIVDVVRPALAKLRTTWVEQLLPVSRDGDHVGLSNVPGGVKGYEALARLYTTTDLSADEIHRIGLKEVERLREEVCSRGAEALAISGVVTVLRRLRDDPGLRFRSADQILRHVTDAYRRATNALPHWFRSYPASECGIHPMEVGQVRTGSSGYYVWPSVDGSRQGAFWVNTHEPRQRSRLSYEVLTFHETVPGHHLQASASADADLPDFRRYWRSSAHAEGWGLYVERLAEDMDLYSSALTRLGMAAEAMLRACRLVVDTGLHHQGWPRRQAIRYLLENTAQPEMIVRSEVDRCVAMPAQALGHTIGQIRIEELRTQAKRWLGARFQIAEFHHRLIAEGSVPIDVLGDVIADWVAAAR